MVFAGIDLIARLLVIERKDAIPWGVDPAADPGETQAPEPANDPQAVSALESALPPAELLTSSTNTDSKEASKPSQAHVDDAAKHVITPLDVLLRLLMSPRAVVCIFSTFVYG